MPALFTITLADSPDPSKAARTASGPRSDVRSSWTGTTRIPASASGARLEVQSLDYRHDPGQRLLEQLSFDLAPGRTVAVVGATASGKSTLTSLVTRLVDPVAGSLRLDGADLRELATAVRRLPPVVGRRV